jgi:CDP-2,3-bis-(O-geranylgeranyl)-sn-glycerol synthase
MSLEAAVRATFILITMSVAGVVHISWLRTKLSQRFAWPVDAGMEFRGKRLFGENKRVCGFMVMPLATALAFMILGGAREELLPNVLSDALWTLTPLEYGLLGMMCGLAFMLAELPNSFIKRQLGIEPGQAPAQSWLRLPVLLIDRYDSVLGTLLVLSLLVPVPLATWVLVLMLGPVLHALFSMIMHVIGIKARAL